MQPDDDSDQTMIFGRSDFEDGTGGVVPADLRRWISAVRLVKLVQDTVAHIPAETAPNPDARHLCAILLWCLATGRYGSWDIEQVCAEEPLCRHLAGSTSPSHGDIHRFRREHSAALESALATILDAAAPDSSILTPEIRLAEVQRRLERARQVDQQDSE